MKKETRDPVSVIIPSYNEEKSIKPQIETIQRVLDENNIPYEIIVIDDGSSDKTANMADKASARVLRHPKNRGYGASLKTGITYALYDTIAIIDADGTYPADQIPNLLDKLKTCDMAVGARTGKDVNIPLIRRPAKWMLGLLAARVAGHKIPDLNSGLRVFRRDCIRQYFSILPNNFSFTTTITLALLGDDYSIIYHPVNYYKRVGKSKIVPRNFMDFIILVLRMAMLFQPLKIFVPLMLICFLAGGGKVIYDLLLLMPRLSSLGVSSLFSNPVPILSTSALLLILAGLQLLLVGMVADGIVRRISQNGRPLTKSFATPIMDPSSSIKKVEQDELNI